MSKNLNTKSRGELMVERQARLASILAEGYLRLLQIRVSNRREIGQFGENGPQIRPPEQLDSFGDQSDE